MENNDEIETTESTAVPEGYYDAMLNSVAYNDFVLSLLLGIIIVYLMITGMRR